MIMSLEELFACTLKLVDPWYIIKSEFKVELDSNELRLDVYVGIKEGSRIPCPKCNRPAVRYGYEPSERSWRHANCLDLPCYVRCRRPRTKCDNCGVRQVIAPFALEYSRHTKWFESTASHVMEHVSRAKASSILHCTEKELASVPKNNKRENPELFL